MPVPATAPSPDLVAAAEAYVKATAAPGLAFDLQVGAHEGDFARIDVVPRAKDADRATAYLKREAGTWKGIDLGTAVACETLAKAGFPEAVSKGCDSL